MTLQLVCHGVNEETDSIPMIMLSCGFSITLTHKVSTLTQAPGPYESLSDVSRLYVNTSYYAETEQSFGTQPLKSDDLNSNGKNSNSAK